MNPENYNVLLEDFDSLYSSSLILSEKETQTSKICLADSKPSIQSSTRPVPVNYEECRNKPPPDVFEYVEVIKDPNDPESVTVIKDTFIQEVIDSSTSVSNSKSNRYKFCREVIQPFLKSASEECIKRSRDNLCNNTVPVPTKVPDQQPRDENYDGMKDIKNKITFDNHNSTMSSKESASKTKVDSTTKQCIKNKNNDIHIKNDKRAYCEDDSESSLKPDSSNERGKEKNVIDNQPETECPKENSQLKKCISACLKSSINLAKKGSAACMEAIGIKQSSSENKPTYYVIKKPVESSSSPNVSKKSSIQSLLETQSQTLSSIKTAVQGFLGSVYQKTKDAVSTVTNESYKRLGLGQKSDSSMSGDSSATSKSNVSRKNSKSMSSCAYSEKGSKMLSNIQTSNLGKVIEPAIDIVENIATSVESTVSYVKEFGMERIIVDHIEAKMNESSPYDNISANNPREVSQEHESQFNENTLFEIMKSKIFSMFQYSTADTDDIDEDDQLFDNFRNLS